MALPQPDSDPSCSKACHGWSRRHGSTAVSLLLLGGLVAFMLFFLKRLISATLINNMYNCTTTRALLIASFHHDVINHPAGGVLLAEPLLPASSLTRNTRNTAKGQAPPEGTTPLGILRMMARVMGRFYNGRDGEKASCSGIPAAAASFARYRWHCAFFVIAACLGSGRAEFECTIYGLGSLDGSPEGRTGGGGMGRAMRAGVRVGLFCFCVFVFVQGEASL